MKNLPGPRVRYALIRPRTVVPMMVGGAALVVYLFIEHLLILEVFAGAAFFFAALSFVGAKLAQKGTETSVEDPLKTLRHALSRAQYEEGTEKPGEQAVDQFDHARAKYRSFQKILSEKLNPEEVTYARYQGAAEQVYLAVIDRLEMVSHLLTGLASAADRAPPLQKIQEILTQNERALADLDRVTLALAEVKTQKGRASMELDLAMKELEELASRAKKYSV